MIKNLSSSPAGQLAQLATPTNRASSVLPIVAGWPLRSSHQLPRAKRVIFPKSCSSVFHVCFEGEGKKSEETSGPEVRTANWRTGGFCEPREPNWATNISVPPYRTATAGPRSNTTARTEARRAGSDRPAPEARPRAVARGMEAAVPSRIALSASRFPNHHVVAGTPRTPASCLLFCFLGANWGEEPYLWSLA